MFARQPLPRVWLMTDERLGDALFAAIGRLPRGAGIVFRHYRTAHEARRALFERVRRIARRRHLVLLLAGSAAEAAEWGADGVHNARRRSPRSLLASAAVHDQSELRRAIRERCDLVFLSPVFPTRSHPGAKTLGSTRFRTLAAFSPVPVIALGGMDARRARRLNAYGWAGIDAWPGDQKRKVVPK